jgi:hypothetical protein
MCTRGRPYGRAGRCSFGGRDVTNGIRADPCSCAYRSVCGHRAHGGMGYTAWRMGRHWAGELDRRGRQVLWGGVNVTPGPIWMAHEWPMSTGVRV